jgi:hypothetical protein
MIHHDMEEEAMKPFTDALETRIIEIDKAMKLLESSVRDYQRLENERRHIAALLIMHNTPTKTPGGIVVRNGDIPLLSHNNTKKMPSGIARDIMAVFMDNDISLPIHEIYKQLQARCIDATPSGINTALRRNTEYFAQVARGKWQLRNRPRQNDREREEEQQAKQENELVSTRQ